VLDYKPFETWAEEGGAETQTLAAVRAEKLLSQYQPPPLDEAIRESLLDYVARRKAEMPDAFA
jgi:Trimethylamine:corrinoid methyltransferase